jgi:hypothetical protein
MAEERVQRKLAAILADDMIGYCPLVRADELDDSCRVTNARSRKQRVRYCPIELL